ncbi:MAG: hypothetical protein AMJ91_06490 [candidate division Zixibacteria bacterium SM23_73_3]|nr:MAG: hypothetical protein AMJ91_06490 [candidate division Zixibacteria bacterium SM23_73_3]
MGLTPFDFYSTFEKNWEWIERIFDLLTAWTKKQAESEFTSQSYNFFCINILEETKSIGSIPHRIRYVSCFIKNRISFLLSSKTAPSRSPASSPGSSDPKKAYLLSSTNLLTFE